MAEKNTDMISVEYGGDDEYGEEEVEGIECINGGRG